MYCLGKQANRFVFFVLEKSALENVGTYAKQVGLSASVEMHHADSSRGTIELLPSLPSSSFIHIDPYEIDKKGDSGVTYLDILIQATQLGIKCLLWYGFMTEDDKESLDNYIVSSLEKAGIKDFFKGKHGRNFLLALDVLLAIAFFAQPDLYYNPQAPDFFDRFYADSLIICGGLWAVLVFLTVKKIHFSAEVNRILTYIAGIATPFIAFLWLEFYNDAQFWVPIFSIPFLYLVLDIIVYYVFFVLFLLIFNSIRAASICMVVVTAVFGIFNYELTLFYLLLHQILLPNESNG